MDIIIIIILYFVQNLQVSVIWYNSAVNFGLWLVKNGQPRGKKLPTILPTHIPNVDGLECTRVLEDLFNLIFLKINDEPKFFALASGSSDSISILHSSLFSISQYLIFIFLQGL